MNKKNIATTVVLLLCSVLFATVGSTFMNLVYEKNKIVVKNPEVVAAQLVKIFASDDEEKTQISQLLFNEMGLGLKPVTGEADEQTNIPSTVTEKNGTEGLYAQIKVTAPKNLQISVTNLKIEGVEDDKDAQKQRKNMWVALKDVQDSAKTLEEDSVVLTKFSEALDEKELIFYFWLSGDGKALKGATISFVVNFSVV